MEICIVDAIQHVKRQLFLHKYCTKYCIDFFSSKMSMRYDHR